MLISQVCLRSCFISQISGYNLLELVLIANGKKNGHQLCIVGVPMYSFKTLMPSVGYKTTEGNKIKPSTIKANLLPIRKNLLNCTI